MIITRPTETPGVSLNYAVNLEELAARFWPKASRPVAPGECWTWTGARDRDGYGQVRILDTTKAAHRVALALDGREPAPGEVTRHRCDNPACVRPEHLETGSHADNTRDKMERGRGLRGEAVASAVLSPALVLEIRGRVRAGASVAAAARELGINYWTAADVARGRTWRHLEGTPAA